MDRSKDLLRKLKVPKVSPIVMAKSRLPVSLRTPRDEKYYATAKQKGTTKPLLEEPRIKEWKYWALIDNDFPYSGAFKVHHLLIPKRIASRKELNDRELDELDKIVDELADKYDCRLINYHKKQSIRNHYHVHFLVYKDSRREMKV